MKQEVHKKMYGKMMKMISDMALKASLDESGEEPEIDGADKEGDMIGLGTLENTPDHKAEVLGSPDSEFTKNLLMRKKATVRKPFIAGIEGTSVKKSPMEKVMSMAESSVSKKGRGRPRKSF